jgi:phosphoenolpyruvate carboxykinase (diphosphate)
VKYQSPRVSSVSHDEELFRYINLKLAALGQPTSGATADARALEIAGPLLRNYYQKDQLLGYRLCPADERIQAFLDAYLGDVDSCEIPRLPGNTFVLDRPGLARVMSLPPSQDTLSSPYLKSYRVPQGILHNPKSDRRTTKGIFHIVEGGLPVPADKIAVPKRAFASLLKAALNPPADVLALPFTADQEEQVRLFVTLLLRPLVCPATGSDSAKTTEMRCFAPASLVSNLDFVEGIFGNGGDPYLPENDAALDVMHWTGHTGCLILAPHIVGLKKKDLGLPHITEATDRQRREGMCWTSEDEVYNDGGAFKIVCRDHRGVMVTIIADNYFGYCKKEVKTQISFAANLYGMCEEEHAGGAIAFPAYVLGKQFFAGRTVLTKQVKFADAMGWLGDRVHVHSEGYASDRKYPDIFYVPENAEFSVRDGSVKWLHQNGNWHQLTIRAGETYVLPWGTKIRLEKQAGGTAWRLVASRADPTLCHKPCTVSGGGKSEISKSIGSITLRGPIFVSDFQNEIEQVADILKRDFSTIFKNPRSDERTKRPILSTERSLGSVIKLMTPSPEYTAAHNAWLTSIPDTVRQLLVTVKRYYQPEWGENWREHFSVDRVNGFLGHELKFESQDLVGNYLRVGYDPDGSWRIYKLRPDFSPADKVQVEDDITASVVLPGSSLNNLDAEYENSQSVKLVQNCEQLLFQRPDDAIHRGFDRDAERDLATPGTFLSNFEPLTVEQARRLVDNVVEFDKYSEPMKRLLSDFAKDPQTSYVVSSSQPRLVDGNPSKNPRYLQRRPDLVNPRDMYLAQIGTRLAREIPADQPVHFPVNAVLAGRRNNPPDPKNGIPPLAVYNPIHYQELPELFMDFICSLTGKSPSTTGFGSEGALTKGPFNALPPVIDVNNALVSAVLTGYAGFTTAAGHVGPKYRMDHDNSMLVPELWCRMRVAEREPHFLIENGYLEKVQDFDFEGRRILASRLGYRITTLFVDRFLGRMFEVPHAVFPEELLRPELQDAAVFASGVDAIVEAQRLVAMNYFEDGSIEDACPPIRALLHVMAFGEYNGLRSGDPGLVQMFTRESLVSSEWYRNRLHAKQSIDIALWARHTTALEGFLENSAPVPRLDLQSRLTAARQRLERVRNPSYLSELAGTIGADPAVLLQWKQTDIKSGNVNQMEYAPHG